MSAHDAAWERLAAAAPARVVVAGGVVERGTRVRLAPRGTADLLDRALAGKLARVEGIEQDVEGVVLLAVVLEDDPGADLGRGRFPGHRFFVAPDEVEALAPEAERTRLLVAGIGNVFLADDGFGVEVARALAGRLPPDVDVVDFGIRGMDLVYALRDYDGAILVDALPLGDAEPGTLAVLRPEPPDAGAAAALDAHGMHPARVLALAAALGRLPEHLLVVGCQPGDLPREEDAWWEARTELGAPVRAAVGRAADLVAALVDGFRARGSFEVDDEPGTSGEGTGTR